MAQIPLLASLATFFCGTYLFEWSRHSFEYGIQEVGARIRVLTIYFGVNVCGGFEKAIGRTTRMK